MPLDHSPLFFDYNATAPLRREAKQAMLDVMDRVGNPASPHLFGRQMRQKLESARQVLTETLGIEYPDAIVFNSGGTEGNNTILKTFENQGAALFVSAIEHACVRTIGKKAQHIPVDQNGIIDLNWLNEALSQCDQSRPILVSVMLVNNETGVIQPLQDVIKIAKKHNAYVHSDAVQALGRIPVTLDLYPVDYMTFSGHKIGGCTGFGALYVKAKSPYTPLILGGGQEKEKRSGTSNTLGAAAFGAALDIARNQDWSTVESLRNALEKNILDFCPKATIWAKDAPRVANTSSIHMPGVPNMTQLMAFDLEGIAVSAGSACSSGKISPSPVLSAMRVTPTKALETIRVSMGPTATQKETDRFFTLWKSIYNRATSTLEKRVS
tara:strand:- start:1673 stop:2815 length:1143 start_codon:yes stop_codon:yes gene_type:complete